MRPVLILMLLAVVGHAIAGDQPQWGQRFTRNMVSTETGLPDTFDPDTGKNLKWSAELGSSTYSTPVVAQGKVFIGTNNSPGHDPRHRGDRGVLKCFDERTGTFLWQLVVPKLPHDPYLDYPGVGITSTAVVEQERVYIVSNRGEVLCLDIHGQSNGNDGPSQDEAVLAAPPGHPPIAVANTDADILWIFDMRRELGINTHDSANVSVLLHDRYLYVSTPNGVNYTHRHRPAPQAPGLIVLDKYTGRLVAQDNTGIGERIFHSTFSSPSLGEVNGRPLVFYGGADGVCYAFEALSTHAPTTLRLVWKFDTDPTAPKENISQYQGNREESPSSIIGMPVFHQNRIYVAAGGDPWHGKRQAWLQCIDATRTGDVTRAALLWSYPLNRHCIGTPAVYDGMVFIGDFGRTLHCVDAQTGRAHWTHETKGEIWGSPLVADGKVFFGTKLGEFWVLAASKEKKVLHSLRFDSPIHTTPVAANRTLFVATMKRLYAFQASP